MNKSECIDLCARMPNKTALSCPYMGLSCRNFYVNLGRGICSEGKLRCSWLPSWVASVSCGCYAILKKDGRLHV